MNDSVARLLLRLYQDVRWTFDRLPMALIWRPTETTILRNCIRTLAPTILDIGANLGTSVAFYRSVYPRAKLVAFEPDPATFEHLKRRHGNKRNTVLLNKGVGARPGKLLLNRANFASVNSFLKFNEESKWFKQLRMLQKTDPVEVDVITLDDVTTALGLEFIDFIKCDTQGFELEVLRGAQRLLKEKRVGLFKLEVLPGQFYEKSVALYDIERVMYGANYELRTISNIHFDRSGEVRYLDVRIPTKSPGHSEIMSPGIPT